jgi:hypothetical protein
MTPPRLIELACPQCDGRVWTVDSDYRGIDGVRTDFAAEPYSCAACGRRGPGWRVAQASPPSFFLQPHRVYPMAQEEFDYWVGCLREHFPNSPKLAQLGAGWRPYLPEEAEAARLQHEAAHPVFEMRDQDGARRRNPDPPTTRDWVDIMVPGDWLEFRRHSGHSLRLVRNDREYIARWRTPDGEDARVREGLSLDAVHQAARAYLDPHAAPVPPAPGKRWRAVRGWVQRSLALTGSRRP